MNALIRILRAAGLVAAVLVLPCCRDQIGKGDQERQITVRASLNLAQIEPNAGCFEPSISNNGRWIVFTSSSSVITANDNNGLRDVFLKDRLTGEIFNLTNVFVFPFFPPIAPADCFEPAVSDDGNFIVFSSVGGWVSYTGPASTNPDPYIYRLNRSNGQFQRAYVTAGDLQPDEPMQQPQISADGQIVAFQTRASNLVPPNGTGQMQVYVYNFNTNVCTLVSRQQSPAPLNAPGNAWSFNPRLSADGNFIAFESSATNINAATAGLPMPQVYRGTATGDYPLPLARDSAGTLTDDVSFRASISGDGRFVTFHSVDQQLVTPAATDNPILVRRDLLNGTTELVTDKPGTIPAPVFPSGYMPSISADGRSIAFLGRDDSLSGGIPLSSFAQVFVRDMQTGKMLYCSRHKDGTPSSLDCDIPKISGDGKWVIWATQGSTLVDGDTNGVSDIFLRGPLR